MESKIIEAAKKIRSCWGADTSSTPGLLAKYNPSLGQCAVTACIVNDLFGGEIVWCRAMTPDRGEQSHYFNVLPDGRTVDLTRDQFSAGTVFYPEGGMEKTTGNYGTVFRSTREYVLSFADTERRYRILEGRVRMAWESARGL